MTTTAQPTTKDLVALALKHAGRATSDAQLEAAAAKLANAAGGSTDAISDALARLLGGLRRNPFLDARGIIAGRILFAARARASDAIAQAA